MPPKGTAIFSGFAGFFQGSSEESRLFCPAKNRDSLWRLRSKKNNEGDVSARCVTYSHPSVDFSDAQISTVELRARDKRVRLVHKDEGIAIIGGVGGHLGTDEHFEVSLKDDGYWWAEGGQPDHPEARIYVHQYQ
ncbi:MAG: hypothetical protein R3F11_18545 [Verrucomicrobiales bacterium]